MENTFSYPVLLSAEHDGGYLVKIPDFPEAITQGDTMDDALLMAVDCLEEAIANRIEMKLDIPAPSKAQKTAYIIPLHPIFAAKVALYSAMREQKLTNISLARKMKCDEKEVRRLIDPHHNSKFPRIEQALFALGKRLQLGLVSYKEHK